VNAKMRVVELRMSQVAEATGGRLVGPDVDIHGASIDSRSIEAGQLFVPVVAERDGHRYIPQALAAGAAGYLTARPSMGATAVEVDHTVAALGALGRYVRARIEGPVVAVTGSVGKTSVKDLLAAAMAARLRTAASLRSYNNELGVPLTLLNAPAGSEAVVVEMGARAIGHIKTLCELATPTVGIVTRVAAVHTELFGTIDDVAVAKAELVEALPANGVAVLNAADPRVMAMAGRSSARVVGFGAGGDVRAERVVLDDELRPSFRLASPWGSVDVRLGVRGGHMVDNALAALAAALSCDVPLADAVAALEAAEVSPWRMELVRAASGGVILNDAYNANPTSMAAALHALVALPARRWVAVLGYMAELGTTSDEEHRAIGALAQDLGIEVVGVGVAGYGGHTVDHLDQVPEVVGPVGDDVAVLLKGSRVAGLERLVESLTH
jgi:UDP-N-acetylmuramoyl-tripeptide--D-alanyl-D-alanine ligase